MSSSPSKSYAPPDGGWGWVVVFGVALANIFNQSLISVFGLLFGEHLQRMGQTTVLEGKSGASLFEDYKII